MKTGIIIIVFNLDARVFILQIEAIKRFCKDDYTIEVVDNSTNQEMSEGIEYHAKNLEVNYRKTVPHNENPSWSHAFAANYAYDKLRDFYDEIAFFDHDLIPVKEFSVVDILGSNLLSGVTQGKNVKYLWPGCLFINNEIEKELVRFDPNHSLRIDTGGELYKALEMYPDRIGYLDEVGCNNPQMSHCKNYYFYIMIHKGTFMHFINSSGWNKRSESNNEQRINSLINIATELMK